MIVTNRARLLLVLAFAIAIIGLVEYEPFLVQLAVAVVLWMGFAWCSFRFRVTAFTRRIVAKRSVSDRSGPARMLWKARPTNVNVQLELRPSLRLLPAIQVWVEDLVPRGARLSEPTSACTQLPLGRRQTSSVAYTMQAETVGAIRFSGLRCVLEDQHGFFVAERFVPLPRMLRVLPLSQNLDTPNTIRKPRNAMPPPGIHSISKAGSGSELLDIRDYVPGDPPKSVAWKVSARRNALMTKQFETEVPVRCQMFVDLARGTRLGYPGPCLAARMIDVAASISHLLIAHRDAVGMSVFDGQEIRISKPTANRRAQLQMMNLLATCVDQPIAPVDTSMDRIQRAAWDLVHLRYPEAMDEALRACRGRIVPQRRKRRQRDCLAAILAAHYALDEWAMGDLSQDDREMSYWLQRFLTDHQVPYVGERFTSQGTYLFDDRAKISQLSRMLLHASSHSRDSELFLVLAELCDGHYDLGPLVNAVKLVVARGHRVAVLCAWPDGMPWKDRPMSFASLLSQSTGPLDLRDSSLEIRQRVNAYHRIRTELGQLRVPVALAAQQQAIPLVAAQLQLVRARRAAV